MIGVVRVHFACALQQAAERTIMVSRYWLLYCLVASKGFCFAWTEPPPQTKACCYLPKLLHGMAYNSWPASKRVECFVDCYYYCYHSVCYNIVVKYQLKQKGHSVCVFLGGR